MTEAPVAIEIAQAQAGVMRLDEFIEEYDRQGPFEIIDGEKIALSPSLLQHVAIAHQLYDTMSPQIKQGGWGVIYFEAPFVLSYGSNWVSGSRVPDILFISRERIEAYRAANPDWGQKPLVIVPDLVVEIISKHDDYVDVIDKVARYLNDGVRIVWVVDPKAQRIVVHTLNGAPRTYTVQDELDGGEVLPDLRVRVAEIFGA
jgi:Uma2 family endonuclease